MMIMDDDCALDALAEIKNKIKLLLKKNNIPQKWCSEKKLLIAIKKKCEVMISVIEM